MIQLESFTRKAAAANSGVAITGAGKTNRRAVKPITTAPYPMSGTTVAAHKDRLKGYETSKGTIRFQPDKPLPVSLVRKMVKAWSPTPRSAWRTAVSGRPSGSVLDDASSRMVLVAARP